MLKAKPVHYYLDVVEVPESSGTQKRFIVETSDGRLEEGCIFFNPGTTTVEVAICGKFNAHCILHKAMDNLNNMIGAMYHIPHEKPSCLHNRLGGS